MALKFKEGNKVVYPSHGVGLIKGIETNIIAGMEIKTYVIEFDKEKMVLRIPVARAEKSGLRALSNTNELDKVNKVLLERPKTSRGMWSRRAKEYESKINSGNIIFVAEVVRDLHKNVDDPERSYSERIIYENALERLAREVSAIKKLDIEESQVYLVTNLNTKNPYFVKKAALAAAKKAEEEALLKGEGDDEDYEDDAIAA
jgi:CarD family transcriptional regulator